MEQQRVMAQHLKEILQDKLYIGGIPEEEKHLPSPEDLKGYVIVKNKKLKPGVDETEEGDDEFSDEEITLADIEEVAKDEESSGEEKEKKVSAVKGLLDSVKGLQRTSSKKKSKVPKIAQELSDLVSYCQATSFKSFDYSLENAKHFEMSSFAEKKAMKFAKEDHQKFIRYNKRQMSRIYPA
jgi:phosphatidylinositol phospholipase C delta